MSETHAECDALRASLETQLATVTRERDEARALLAESRKGQPLGPVIGAMTIAEQELELKKLRALLKHSYDYKEWCSYCDRSIDIDQSNHKDDCPLAAALGDTTGGTGR